MPVRMRITVDIASARTLVGAVAERANNPGPALRGPLAEDLRSTFAGIWLTAGESVGESWPPLAESTLKRKPGNSAELLVASGDLRGALIEKNDPHGFYELIAQNELQVSVEGLDYAGFHLTGTAIMPARKYIPDEWPAADVERWAGIVADYVADGAL